MVKCLSCGQPRTEPLREAGLPTELSYSSRNLEAFSRSIEESEQRSALSRAGGLRPLGRTYVPMVPKVFPSAGIDNGMRRSRASSSQPLFQRARVAMELKEVVKVPGVGDISPSLVLDDEAGLSRGPGALPNRKSRKLYGTKTAPKVSSPGEAIGMSLSADR